MRQGNYFGLIIHKQCDTVLAAEGPEHYAIWKHLPDIIRDGRQDGFVREFGAPSFEYAKGNERYRRTFDRAMTGHSIAQSNLVLEALRDYDFSSLRTICDVGGGHGYLICALLNAHPHLSGFVLDLPEVFNDPNHLWARKLGVEDRCTYVSGPIVATALVAEVGDWKAFSSGRSLAAWIGLVPSTTRRAARRGLARSQSKAIDICDGRSSLEPWRSSDMRGTDHIADIPKSAFLPLPRSMTSSATIARSLTSL